MHRKVPLALSLSLSFGLCAPAALAQMKTAPSDSPAMLPEVVSTGQAEDQSERKEAPAQVLVVSEEDVQRYNDATVGDVLRRLPGMTFSGPAGVPSTIRMRGLGAGYTQILINGEPVPAASANRQMSVNRLPAHMIERIEIVRAPSAEMESAGIGGTVNIVLKQDAEPLTRVSAAYGRNGVLNAGNAVVQWNRQFGNLGATLGLSHTRGAQDVTDETVRYNPATGDATRREVAPRTVLSGETLLTPQLSWNFADGRLILDPFVSLGNEQREIDSEVTNGAGAITQTGKTSEYRQNQIARLSGRYEGATSWGEWYAKLGLQQGRLERDQNAKTFDPAGAVTATTAQTEKTQENQGYVGTGLALPLGAHTLKAGIEYRDTGFGTRLVTGATTAFNIQERRTVAYLMDEWRLSDAHWLTPGLRLENFDRTATDINSDSRTATYLIPNPSLHYRWAMTPSTNFRASYAQTLRNPSFADLNPLLTLATGADAGSIDTPDQAGNADLRPERSTGFDLGLEQFLWGEAGVIGLNLYHREIHDFIESRIGREGARYVARPQNVGQARIYGAELDLRLPILRQGENQLTLMGSHAEMRGEVQRDGKTLDIVDVAPRVSTLGLDYRHASTGWNAGFSFNHWPTFTARSEDADGNRLDRLRRENPILDLYLAKAVSPATELRLSAKNVLSVVGGGGSSTYNADGSLSARSEKFERSHPIVLFTVDTMF